MRCRRWAGVRNGDRMASFHGQPIVPAEVQEPPFWRRNPVFNQLYCSVYHLNDSTLPAYVAELERFDPAVMVGYTSAIHRVATHLLERGDVGRVRPRAALVSSETLLPGARADIEAAFGCRVHNAYSLGELVAFITECSDGGMHISTDYGVVEYVDGEIVASGLINRGMPLLRYRTGDLAAPAAGSCSCGRGLPCVTELVGRVDDVVRTPEGAVVGPAPMSLAFQRVPHLRRAQVHQDRIGALRILLETTAAWSEDDHVFLIAELRKRLGSTIELDTEVVDVVPRTSGGKERLVWSTLGRGSGSA
jgi:phenylacetate-CoA ligase